MYDKNTIINDLIGEIKQVKLDRKSNVNLVYEIRKLGNFEEVKVHENINFEEKIKSNNEALELEKEEFN